MILSNDYLISLLVNFLCEMFEPCELGQIMTKYDFLDARMSEFEQCSNQFQLDLISLLVNSVARNSIINGGAIRLEGLLYNYILVFNLEGSSILSIVILCFYCDKFLKE